jgi:ABC-type lipoprotein release transport system permease subunit
MGRWFEEITIFFFTYGWFFGFLSLILGIIGAVYFSYYPNVGRY